MSRLLITGDIHGDAVGRFKPHIEELKAMTKDDIVFIVGDCGLPFGVNNPAYEIAYKAHDMYHLDWLSQFDCTFLFLRGNHDDIDAINQMPRVEKYGGELRQMVFDEEKYDNIFYVDDPTVLTLCEQKCLCIPGAESHDILYRIEHWDWWQDEAVDIEKVKALFKNDEDYSYDLILTHESPALFLDYGLHGGPRYRTNAGEELLDNLRETLDFKAWYHGHMHMDYDYPEALDGRIHCLFFNIVEIKED